MDDFSDYKSNNESYQSLDAEGSKPGNIEHGHTTAAAEPGQRPQELVGRVQWNPTLAGKHRLQLLVQPPHTDSKVNSRIISYSNSLLVRVL